jgi:hypothetical protein
MKLEQIIRLIMVISLITFVVAIISVYYDSLVIVTVILNEVISIFLISLNKVIEKNLIS